MFKRFHAALAALILLASTPALAADNYQVKDANGTNQTIRAKDTGTGYAPQFVPSDATGAPVTAAPGTSAPSAVGVQGVTNGVAQNVETVQRSTSADRSGTLATAGTAQTLVPANTARRGLAIQNKNAPGSAYSQATSIFMNCLTTAAVGSVSSLEIPAGALYETPSHHVGTGACSFVSGTSNTPVYVREF